MSFRNIYQPTSRRPRGSRRHIEHAPGLNDEAVAAERRVLGQAPRRANHALPIAITVVDLDRSAVVTESVYLRIGEVDIVRELDEAGAGHEAISGNDRNQILKLHPIS